MGDYDQIGKVVDALYRLAIIGSIAIVILGILAMCGLGWFGWWLWHHV